MTDVDVAIIGAGINGAGIARELSRRGVSVALFDKGDIGSGTSSASSKLLHGGIRYLEHGDLRLVFEACQERHHWLTYAPHLTRRQSFLIPIYSHHKRPKWMVHSGILLYNLLSGFKQIGRNRMLSVSETLQRQPTLNPKGLLGSALYYDAQVDDARMCLEAALQAESWGAQCYTYHRIDQIRSEKNAPHILEGTNILKNKPFKIAASGIVQTTGPWTDQMVKKWGLRRPTSLPLLRPSLGSHIVTAPFLKEDALLISANDGRVFFAIPWQGKTLIGTTDHAYEGNPDTADITQKDVDYLMENLYALMPNLPRPLPILGTFSGIRPLSLDNRGTVGSTSREHRLIWLSEKHLCITGGKYTTFRRIAKEAADTLIAKLRLNTTITEDVHPLFGGKIDTQTQENLYAQAPHLPDLYREALLTRYGTAAHHVLPYLSGHNNREIAPCLRRGEIVYMIAVEKAKTLDDLLRRRTHVFIGLTDSLLQEIAQVCTDAWHWDDVTQKAAIANATERYIDAPHRLSTPST